MWAMKWMVVVAVALGMSGCGWGARSGVAPFLYLDRNLPGKVSLWCQTGPQTRVTPVVEKIVKQIEKGNRREKLYQVAAWARSRLKYESWYLEQAFTRTADELLVSGILGSCSDYALAQVALLRALGVPAALVLTVNTDWVAAYQHNDLAIPRGHVFVEVFLERAWFLWDPAYFTLYSGYIPSNKHYPRKEYFMARARDFVDVGLCTMADVVSLYKTFADQFNPDGYRVPHYRAVKLK